MLRTCLPASLTQPHLIMAAAAHPFILSAELMPVHEGGVQAVAALSDDLLVSGGDDRMLVVWRRTPGSTVGRPTSAGGWMEARRCARSAHRFQSAAHAR